MKKLSSLFLLALLTTLIPYGYNNTKNLESLSQQTISPLFDSVVTRDDASAEVVTITEHSVPLTAVKTESDTFDDLEVHFLDVGQGDATLIKCGGESLLIDAGDNSKGTAVQLYLQKQGITKLDYLIGTHHDEDHIGGLDVIITKFDCEKIIMPDDYKDTDTYRDVIAAMEYKGYQNTVPNHGETYRLGDAEFTLLQHSEYGDHSNNSSVGIILEHGDKRFLFTGDAEEEAEADIIGSGVNLSCDVYKAGHHGSHTSSSAALLSAAKPTYAVISCGKGNAYGHPRAETLNKFRMSGIKVFRTDEQGTIVAKSDGKEIAWDCSPSESWVAGEPTGGTQTQSNQVQGNEIVSETGALATRQNNMAYILNTNSKKFHKPTCNTLPSDKNRKDSDLNRDEIIAQGYVPCKRCNP